MIRDKIDSYLGFAVRSRSLVSGYNSCIHEIQKGKAYLILLTNDLKAGTKKKFEELARSHKIPISYFGTMESLETITGIKGRGIFAITDKNLGSAIEREATKNRSEVY